MRWREVMREGIGVRACWREESAGGKGSVDVVIFVGRAESLGVLEVARDGEY